MTCTITVGRLTTFQTDNGRDKITQKQRILAAILERCCQGYTDFYVNCERGVPLWAAEAICFLKSTLKIGLHIVVPFENQCMEWTDAERDRYYSVHEKSDSVIFACHRFQPDCYQLADKLMLDRSNLLLVFGNTTSDCYAVDFAKKLGMAVQYVSI